MAIRLFNLSKWWLLEGGSAYRFDNAKVRTVTLEVNSSERCELYIRQQGDDPELRDDIEAGRVAYAAKQEAGRPRDQLLAVVDGRETIEFGVDGPFEIQPTVDCWVFSMDGQPSFSVIEEPVIFTRVANRRERNRHLEIVEFKMRENQRRFMEAVGQEIERRTAAIKEGLERHATQRHQKPVTHGTGTQVPAPEAGGEPDAGQTADEGVSVPPKDGGKAKPSGGGKAGKAAADVEDGR